MKNVISITEARKRLPGIIRSLKSSLDTVYQITVHDEVVAEIRRPPMAKPGEAASRLLAIRKKLKVSKRGRKVPVSKQIKEHLYVTGSPE
jgi:hypothetical protein